VNNQEFGVLEIKRGEEFKEGYQAKKENVTKLSIF
jgi:hypothetical protein